MRLAAVVSAKSKLKGLTNQFEPATNDFGRSIHAFRHVDEVRKAYGVKRDCFLLRRNIHVERLVVVRAPKGFEPCLPIYSSPAPAAVSGRCP
jgi:hypothetical protein